MAKFDYDCDVCGPILDVDQPIGSDPLRRCPEGHPWKRIFGGAKVKIDGTFRGHASISPQFEVMDATGDPTLAFGHGKPSDDVNPLPT